MHGKITPQTAETCAVLLSNGESFHVEASELPEELRAGGEARLVLVPGGETASENQARMLLNYLLEIK
jgi:hypothetical protein